MSSVRAGPGPEADPWRRWPGGLAAQRTQPLVLLLAVAAVPAWVGGTPTLGWAVLAVLVLALPFVVRGIDELVRGLRRSRASAPRPRDLGPCPTLVLLTRLRA